MALEGSLRFAFELDQEWAAKKGEIRQVTASIAMQAATMIVHRTPVKTGLFKANWRISIGRLNGQRRRWYDKNGSATIALMQNQIEKYYRMEGFPRINISNPQPYAQKLEGGYSMQAPNGMVAITLAELEYAYNGYTI